MSRALAMALMWVAYVSIHSALASLTVKGWVRERLPILSRYYGYFFILQAALLLIPIAFVLYLDLESPRVWAPLIPEPFNWVAAALFVGLAGVAVIQVELHSLARSRVGGRLGLADRASPLVTTGLYGFCRHPMGLFTSLALPFLPLNATQAISALFIAAYVFFGSRLEERKLLVTWREPYKDYMREVSRFLPLKFIWRLVKRRGTGAMLMLLLASASLAAAAVAGCARGERVEVSDLGLSMTLPEGWTADAHNDRLFADNAKPNDNLGGVEDFALRGKSLGGLVDQQIAELEKLNATQRGAAEALGRFVPGAGEMGKQLDIKVLARDETEVNGSKSVRLVTTVKGGYTIMDTYIEHGDRAIRIWFRTIPEEFSAAKPMFEASLETLELD